MEIIKKVLNVDNHQIIIHLPDEFNNTRVEVIVVPYIEKPDRKQLNNLQEWEDIVGIAEFENDASLNHDMYISKAL